MTPERARRPAARDATTESQHGAAPLSGILVVAKPAGPTSHDVVALVRRLSGARRVGHGGTLDPFASGVLPVFVGGATRMVEYHLADPKAYRAIVCLGARSSTDDLEGELVPGEGPAPGEADVREALTRFVGRVSQRPPDYSAVKVAGRRAYELARRGERPEIRERTVEVHGIELIAWDGTDPSRPAATVEVSCSAGTYIRAIARDLGEVLGCGAYLGSLVRLASGPFRLDQAVSLDAVRELATAGELGRRLLRPDHGLDGIPAVSLDAASLAAVGRGQVVRARGTSPAPGATDGLVRVVDAAGRLVAMARLVDGRLHPDKVLSGEA